MRDRIGVISRLPEEGSFAEQVTDLGLKVCQLVSWEPALWTAGRAVRVREQRAEGGVRICAFWAGWPAPAVWDFVEGPTTLGIVPAKYRQERVEVLKRAGDFARQLEVKAVITHLGFIPENAGDPAFKEVVEAVREIALHYQQMGLEFWFETGQETPVTMRRLIEQVGTDNLGINLDPANLILYGKGNPIDALDVFGEQVKNLHVKDGFYPTDPMKLGEEVPVGQGKVCFPEFVSRLGEIGFAGEYIIEREISGEEQKKDIRATVTYLKELLGED